MSKRFTDEQHRQWLASRPKKTIDVKVILKSDKGNILLIKPDYKYTWQLPGGGVEANEDPRLAAVREVEEETGLQISADDLSLINYVYRTDKDHLFLVFEYGGACDESHDYAVEDEEIEEYKFTTPSEVIKLLPQYYHDFWKQYIANALK